MPPRTPLFEIRDSPIHGRGGFALRTIRRGARVVEYTGERISQEESARRYSDTDERANATYLFDLDDGETCIDGAAGGNGAERINHSCEPNCEAVQFGDRVFIVAMRTIRAGEELSYDYHYSIDGEFDAETARRIYACRCGAARCRGTMVSEAVLRSLKRRRARKR